RDIYNREIEEVIVEGEDGYKSAKSFMKMLMPSHARRVKAYSDPVPLFQRYGAEDQLRAMYDPMVQLKSGGYLVINPTEALVSIDINSGRSTKEHGIEQTAVATNLEAAREIARQLRLRDMAGLVVIDFIDMEYNSNVRKVEKAMKEALKTDRARIQVGRISGFGLMEMSRQRLRTGVLEATTRECPHCDGTGLVRTASSAGLSALRLIEDEAAKGKGTVIRLAASTEAAVYLLNAKRADLAEIEERYNVSVEVMPEGEDEGAKMSVVSAGPRPAKAPRFEPIVDEDEDEDDAPEDFGDDEDDAPKKKRRRRRRGGRGRNKNRGDDQSDSGSEDAGDDGDSGDRPEASNDDDGDEKPKKRRRRGGRGRRRKESTEDTVSEADTDRLEDLSEQVKEDMTVVSGPDDSPETAGKMAPDADDAPAEEKPKRKRAPRKKKVEDTEAAAETASTENAPVEEKPKRKRASRAKKKVEEPAEAVDAEAEPAAEEKPAAKKAPAKTARKAPAKKAATKKAPAKAKPAAAEPDAVSEEPTAPSGDAPAKGKRGWWQRTFGE
ncbi:MAG: ribonuclease E/G, partial [Pseudomonadota bacterium]